MVKNKIIFFYKWCYRFVLVEYSLAADTAIVDNVNVHRATDARALYTQRDGAPV